MLQRFIWWCVGWLLCCWVLCGAIVGVASCGGLTRLLFPRVAGGPTSCRTLCPPERLGRNTEMAHFTPDPANFLRFNGLFAYLVSCGVTGSASNVFCIQIRSASRGHGISNTMRIVLRNLSCCKVGPSRNIVTRGRRGNTCNPCGRDREGSVCRTCTGRLIRRKLTCPYFYSRRRLRQVHRSRRNRSVGNCCNRCTTYHGLDFRRVDGGVTTNRG